MTLPATADLTKFTLIELGVTNGKVSKIVVRGEYNSHLDIAFVIVPQTSTSGVVKTVWFNVWDDTHRTLNRSRYATY